MKYKFSVIIPIYNSQEYLEDAIKSIINQSIGFEENIQLILVNDGSTDKSENICIKYRDDYPENIIYIKQENRGVSSARNAGIQHIQGKYVNFLDSDDKWNYDAFDIVYDFFEEHQGEIDVVSCREKFFEGKEGYHLLDYKFEENKIVDIREKYNFIQLSTSTAFIKKEVLEKYKYDIKLKYSEDTVLINQILMEKSKYGIIVDAVYNYRKRNAKTSALQIRDKQKKLYFDFSELDAYRLLFDYSVKKYGKIILYFQYLVMYNLQWKIKNDISMYLDEKEQNEYIEKLKKLLDNIDDKIILELPTLWNEYKIITLSLKYGEDIREKFVYNDGKIFFKDNLIYKLSGKSAIKIIRVNLHRTYVVLIGQITYFIPKEDYKLYINIDGENYEIRNYKIFRTEQSILRQLNHYREFKIKIPIKSKRKEIRFVIDYRGNKNNLSQKFEKKGEIKGKISKKRLGVSVKGERDKIIIKRRKNIFK